MAPLPKKYARLYSLLALTGAVPFVLAALLLLAVRTELIPPYSDQLPTALAAYGLAIIAFLSGSHWGLFKWADHGQLPNYFLLSNAITLAAIFGFILLPPALYYGLLILLFLLLLWFEKDFHRIGVTGLHYLRIRVTATLIVVSSLTVSALTFVR